MSGRGRYIGVGAGLCLLALSFGPAAAQQVDCIPGITFGSLLGNLSVGYGDGRLNLDKLYAVCLPVPTTASNPRVPYDPDGGGKLSTALKTADGRTLNTYVWYAERIGTLWEMSRYKVIGGYQALKPLASGSYVLEFAADDQPFYRFPFTVRSVRNDDPYEAPGDRYFIDGAWSDYGNLYYQRNDPKSSLTFTTWVQDRAARQGRRSVPYEIKLVRTQDEKVLGEDSGTLRLEPRWLRATLYFRPAGDRNAYLKAADVLERDGAYRILLSVEGKAHGEYPFTVKGGRIELQGRQVREKTDPMAYITDHISGGRYTSWWLARDTRAK
jgi:hypothetical protein